MSRVLANKKAATLPIRPDIDLQRCTSLKVSGLAEEVDTEDLKELFATYETLMDVYIPMNLRTRHHRGFAFIRFRWKDEADACMLSFSGHNLKGSELKIDYAVQNSFFTQDTGYITNEALDSLPERGSDFEPGMPDAHFETLRYLNRDLSDQITIRVGNLGHGDEVNEAVLRDTFEEFGELASVYRPFDKGFSPIRLRDFAFVRFIRKSDGETAAKEMHLKWLMGRELHINIPKIVENFSQNESRQLPPVF